MFEKFDFNAIQAFYLAEEEVLQFGLRHIDVDLLVAGILRWYGPNIPKELTSMTLAEYREKYETVYGRGHQCGLRPPGIVHTPALKRVLEYAYINNDKVTVDALVDAVLKQPHASLLLFK